MNKLLPTHTPRRFSSNILTHSILKSIYDNDSKELELGDVTYHRPKIELNIAKTSNKRMKIIKTQLP